MGELFQFVAVGALAGVGTLLIVATLVSLAIVCADGIDRVWGWMK